MMEKPANYRIRVEGELPARWLDRFEGMTVSVDRSTSERTLTTLVGRLRDQAALSGLLNTLYDLHLPVLSVECLERSDPAAGRR
jgi:hypothetical protein